MAQFSGPYAVAAGLFGGGGLGVGLDDFTDDLARDPARRALMAKVTVTANQECTEIFPHQLPAILTVSTTDGRELTEKVLVNRGGPQRPLSYSELATKFRDNASRLMPAEIVEQTLEQVSQLDQLSDVTGLLAPLSTVTSAPANRSTVQVAVTE